MEYKYFFYFRKCTLTMLVFLYDSMLFNLTVVNVALDMLYSLPLGSR